jgi:hypothetical protein
MMRDRLFAVILVLVVSLPLVAGGELAGARKRNVTKTFSNTAAIAIPVTGDSGPGNPYPSTIEVTGFNNPNSEILDVNVTLRSISHTHPPEMDILLVASAGTNAMIMSDTGSNQFARTSITVKLDDEARKNIDTVSSKKRLESGTYQPFNRAGVEGSNDSMPAGAPATSGGSELSVFDGIIDPNGTWKLYIADDATFPQAVQTGTLGGGWTLQIKASR